MELEQLRREGLLKNHKFPFFIFKDNRNYGYLTNSDENKTASLKSVCDLHYESFAMYKNYLPRVNVLRMLETHPELEDYFQRTKHGIGEVNRYNLDSLISENGKLDWFIYDDESVNFLLALEKLKFIVRSTIKYSPTGKVYFEDQLPYITLKEKDIEKLFINVTYITKNVNEEAISPEDIITKKLKITSKTTSLDILNTLNKKLSLMDKNITFDPNAKMLKVKSLCDYIINRNAPLIQFAYINYCVTRNLDPEYIVIDDPFTGNEPVPEETNRNSNSNNEDLSIDNTVLERTRRKTFFEAKHSNDVSAGNAPIYEILQKVENVKEQPEHKESDLDLFMKDIINDINKETQIQYENASKIINESLLLNTTNVDNTVIEEEQFDTFGNSLYNDSHNNTSFYIPIRNTITGGSVSSSRMSMANLNINTRPSIMNAQSFSTKKKKILNKPKTPNTFIEENKKLADIKQMLKVSKEPIVLEEIDRPFSIVLRDAKINDFYNSFPYDKKIKTSVLVFKFQIFCGNEPYSKSKKIKWISKQQFDKHPCFNKRLYFDLNYKMLPDFASLLIKVKHTIFEKERQQVLSNKTIGWANFKLFDHNKRLMTGVHKLNLLDTIFTEDCYFYYIDNINNPDASSVYFEIESFDRTVINEKVILEEFNPDFNALMINKTDDIKIKEITCKGPFDELNNYDKEVLWTNRYILSQEPTILPKLLSCIDYKNTKHLIELEKIISIAKPLSPVKSMELLTGKYLHESIREFAVKCLYVFTPQEVETYLLQLVQGLKYEMKHDNKLAEYLLGMAVNYPLTIGHSFFWSLRSEMYNPIMQQRFGLYLQVFLDKIGSGLRKIFEDEAKFIYNLLEIAEIPKKKISKKKKDEVKGEFIQALILQNDAITKAERGEVSLPLNFKYRIKGFKVDKCRYMKSKKKPLWLVMENAEPNGEDIIVLFKKGDDLRMDIVTLQLFKIMQTLWFENDLRLKMSLYTVISTGYYQGMLEIVQNAKTLAEIHKQEGGAFQSFTKKSLKKWLEKGALVPEDEYTINFLLSNVAYCCATFVLGVGDRHSDNIMVKRNGELFHIDFGHFLGHFKYKMGIKRERAPFVFTKQFVMVLGGDKSECYGDFKEKFWKSYQILRNNADVVVTLLRILLTTGIPELTEKSIRYVEQTLCLNNNEEAAKKYLEEKLEESLNSWSVELNFWIHILANK